MAQNQSSVCIVLNVDQRYLDGAKVTISSLRRNGCVSEIPIIVVTSDTAVQSDPYISATTTVHNLTDEESQRLHSIELIIDRPLPNDPVNRRAMKEIRSRYFEKFFVCKDFGYSANIFLDSDILCLGSISDLTKGFEGLDFQAAPALIAGSIFSPSKDPRPRTELDLFRRDHFQGNSWSKNFNSGVFVASGRCIGDKFVTELIDEAIAMNGAHGDQPVFHRVVHKGDYRYRSLHPWFNVERPYYTVFGECDFKSDLEKIRLLHFTGHQKPWQTIDWRAGELRNVEYMYRLYLQYLAGLKSEECGLALKTASSSIFL